MFSCVPVLLANEVFVYTAYYFYCHEITNFTFTSFILFSIHASLVLNLGYFFLLIF